MTSPPEAEPSATPPAGAGHDQDQSQRRSFGVMLRESFLEGNTVTVTVLALLTATVLGGLLAAFTNTTVLHAPNAGSMIARAWDVASGTYVALFEGSVFNPHTVAALFQQASLSTAIHDGYLSAVFGPLSETAVQATPLILTGLAVALPYQAGLFNIGGQGQFIGGAIMAAWLGYYLSLPFFVHVVVCVHRRFRRRGRHRLAHRRDQGANRRARGDRHDHAQLRDAVPARLPAGFAVTAAGAGLKQLDHPAIASNAHLPLLAGTSLRINAGFLVAIACAFAIWWLLNRTTTGFEFRSVGANASAARVAGIKVERSWVLSFLIAGGLAGLAGSAVIQGTDFTLNPQSFGTYGIDAITVALLGLGRPWGVVWAGLLFGALHAGSPGMQTVTSTPVQIVQVLQALIVLFVAAPPLIRAIFRLREARAGGVGAAMSKGWNA